MPMNAPADPRPATDATQPLRELSIVRVLETIEGPDGQLAAGSLAAVMMRCLDGSVIVEAAHEDQSEGILALAVPGQLAPV